MNISVSFRGENKEKFEKQKAQNNSCVSNVFLIFRGLKFPRFAVLGWETLQNSYIVKCKRFLLQNCIRPNLNQTALN